MQYNCDIDPHVTIYSYENNHGHVTMVKWCKCRKGSGNFFSALC